MIYENLLNMLLIFIYVYKLQHAFSKMQFK